MSSPFTEFLLYLQEQGVPLGVSAHVAVDKLAARWADSNRDSLKEALAALLARSPGELQLIRELFDRYYATHTSPAAEPEPPQNPLASSPAAAPTVITAAGLRWRDLVLRGVVLIGAVPLVIVLVCGTVLLQNWSQHRPPHTVSQSAESSSGNSGRDLAAHEQRDQAMANSPPPPPPPGADSPPEQIVPQDLGVPPPDLATPPAPRPADVPAAPPQQLVYPLGRAVACGGSAFLLVFIALYRARLRRHRLAAGQAWAYTTLAQMPGPQLYRWRLHQLGSPLRRADIDEFALLLHRLCAEPGAGRVLDVERTVDKFARTGRLGALLRRSQPLRRAIVVLIDYGHASRVFTAKLDALVEGLMRRGIPVARWYFDNDATWVSAAPFGPPVSLLSALGPSRDVPGLVLSYGSDLDDLGSPLPTWVKMLSACPRWAFLHPVTDPDAWPIRLQRAFPIAVWPMNRVGLRGAAYALAYDRALGTSSRMDRARIRLDAPIDLDSVRGLLRLVALAPRPTVEVVELLRQLYHPDVPDQVVLHIVDATTSPGGVRLRFSDKETALLIAELRRGDATREQAARRALLDALADSAPPASSVAHLRWRLDRALQELHLLPDPAAALERNQDQGPQRAVTELLELAASPILDEVADSLRTLRLPGERFADPARTVAVQTQLPSAAVRQLARARVPASSLRLSGGTRWPRPGVRDTLISLLAALMVCLALWGAGVLRLEPEPTPEPPPDAGANPTPPEPAAPEDLQPADLIRDLSPADLGRPDALPFAGAQTGRLRITLTVAGVTPRQVFVDGQPWGGGIVSLPPGEVTVILDNASFKYRKTVKLLPGQETQLTIRPSPSGGIIGRGVSPPTTATPTATSSPIAASSPLLAAGGFCQGANCPCTPGVNCRCTPGVNCPCKPGVDCPCPEGKDCACEEGKNCACTPGVNCPCTPGEDCVCTPDKDCPKKPIRLKGESYNFDSTDLTEEGKQTIRNEIDKLIEHLKAGGKIRVEGHVDNVGDAAWQAVLSRERARSMHELIVTELRSRGISEEILTTQVLPFTWYGANCPAVPPSKHDPNKVAVKLRAQETKLRDDENEPNRRVEINQFPSEFVKCYVPLPPQP